MDPVLLLLGASATATALGAVAHVAVRSVRGIFRRRSQQRREADLATLHAAVEAYLRAHRAPSHPR